MPRPTVGLSYTGFNFSAPSVSSYHGQTVGPNTTVQVTVRVTNTGQMAGAATVQLYAKAPLTRGVNRNQRTLVGFTKVEVGVGATVVALLLLNTADLGRYDPYARQWVVDTGDYTLYAQSCAGASQLSCTN